MADYRVNLEIFAGPLDLLLYLVRKEEVDIYDIPLTKITNQYLRYLEMIKTLDIDLAGDFLVMAATLMQIKSAMLLPKTETEDGDLQDAKDPRAELIRQLLEYKKFKDAANLLADSAEEQKQRFARPNTIVEQLKNDNEPDLDLDLEQISIWDLLEAFDAIMASMGPKIDLSKIVDDTPIDVYQIEILHRLQTDGPVRFEKVFEGATNRLMLVGLFLALLELIRENLAKIDLQESANCIYVMSMTDEPAEEAVQKAIIDSEPKPQAIEAEQNVPPIAIVEIPKPQTAETEKTLPPIPIAELPPKKTSTTSDLDMIEPAADNSKS